MADFATVEEAEDRLGRALSTEEAIRLTALLADASAAIRAEAGQEITAGVSTVWLSSCDNIYRLSQTPVTAVTAVLDADGDPVDFTWLHGQTFTTRGYGLARFDYSPAAGRGSVQVTYEHGYATAPPILVAVASQMALRAMGSTPDQSGITQETVGPFSRTLGSAAAAGAVGLLRDERAIVARFSAGSQAAIGTITVSTPY